MTAELLFVGDIHLGRRPTGLGGVLAEIGLDPHALSPAAAWRAVVGYALRRRPSAVVLAGDVVEGERDRFEAFAHLERGVSELAKNGIAVFGVAGNHDGLVLPRLAERIPDFCLLGVGGRWEARPLAPDLPVDLLGWSFPQRHVTTNPLEHEGLAAALAARRPDAALLGVLHADLDQANSPYAPVSRAELARLDVDAWFVGHVHRPDPLEGPRPVGYLGSLVGLDPGEPGWRGPWSVEVHGPRAVQARRLPGGPIRWEVLELDLDRLDAPGSQALDVLHERVHEALRTRVAEDPTLTSPNIALVAARLHLRGRPAHRPVARELAALPAAARILHVDGTPWCIEAVVDHTRPRVDLEELARQNTPPGLLAARLLALERGDPEADEWVRALDAHASTYTTGPWAEVEAPLRPAREVAMAAGLRLLDELLAMREVR